MSSNNFEFQTLFEPCFILQVSLLFNVHVRWIVGADEGNGSMARTFGDPTMASKENSKKSKTGTGIFRGLFRYVQIHLSLLYFSLKFVLIT